MPRFTVTLGATVFEYYDVDVDADSASEAESLARDYFSSDRAAFPACDRDTSDPADVVDVQSRDG